MALTTQADKYFQILMIEDNPDDAFLIQHALASHFPNAEFRHVPGRQELEAFLAAGGSPDVVLSDWSLPQFDGLSALEMMKTKKIDAPFIILSGKIGEDAAITAIRRGVYDYVLKDNLGRLPTAIRHALEFHQSEKQRKKELELNQILSVAAGQAQSPEGLCLNIIAMLKEHYPETRQGICLFTDGETKIEKSLGEKQMKAGDMLLFQRTLILEEETLGTIQILYPGSASLDYEKLFASLAGQMETALQRIVAQLRISTQIRNISFLQLISRTISPEMDVETVITPLLAQIRKLLDSDAIALYLNDKNGVHLSCRAHDGFRTNLIENASVGYGEPYAGLAAKEQRIVSVSNFGDIDGESQFAQLVRAEAFVSQHCAPIIIAKKTMGVLEVFQRKPFIPSSEWLILFDAIAMQAGLALDYTSIYADLQKAYLDLELSYEATIEGWSAAMDFRDQETEGHSKRVASLTISLAERLGVSEEEITYIARGALLHDVGKIGIPDSVLKKAGPLDEDEWKLMRQHPRIAREMLAGIPHLASSLDIPLYHHEKWDGSGYPEGLKGEKIPFAARLFSVIDVFDALTSDRPYRRAWSNAEALSYIKEQAGIQFDPLIVGAFVSMIETEPA